MIIGVEYHPSFQAIAFLWKRLLSLRGTQTQTHTETDTANVLHLKSA
jgi:hypothetical protein